MLNDDGFFSSHVTEENIAELNARQSLECERRICELYELACDAADATVKMYADGYGIYEILGILSDGLALDESYAEHSAAQMNRDKIASYLRAVSVRDKATFARLFFSELTDRGIVLLESDFLTQKPRPDSIAYVKNRLADEAYDVFSEQLSDPRVAYVTSFKDAARAVSSGEVGYCLLPLEERGGARLAGISELLFSEDLKINSVTPVFGFDGSADMKYALVSRSFTVPELLEDDDRYLEIRIDAERVGALSEIFSVADTLGASVYRVNTALFRIEGTDLTEYTVVFKRSGAAFSELLLYLTLFSGDYSAVGIYKNLE